MSVLFLSGGWVHMRYRYVVACGLLWQSVATSSNKGAAKSNAVELFPADGPKIPLGLVQIIFPDDKHYSPEQAQLRWILFFDKRVSSNGSVSCASCHSPEHGFGDGQPVSTGIGGQKGGRSAPSVINRG